MQRQSERQNTPKTVVRRDRRGNIKRITTGTKEYTFNERTKTWKSPEPKKYQSKKYPGRSKKHQHDLRLHATKAELLVCKIFRETGIKHKFQHVIVTDKESKEYSIADFVLPALRIILEIDGYYHFDDFQKKIDEQRTGKLEKTTGYKVVRLTNEQVINTPMMVVDLVYDHMKGIIQRDFNR